MPIIAGAILDAPTSPLAGGELRSTAALLVTGGQITDSGSLPELAARHPDEPVQALTGGVLIPGLIDTHVHFPQVRVIGGLGLPLLDWLDHYALPEEARLADVDHATAVADEFVSGLLQAGTTTALVFGAHFASAVDALFTRAGAAGLRITSGLVVSDRGLRPDLLVDPSTAYHDGAELASRWHGVGRARYAVTPRFSLSATDEMLLSCRALLAEVPGAWFTSHVNENDAEIAAVADLFPQRSSYTDTYAARELLGQRSVLAHNVHPTDAELAVLAGTGTAVAHCPTSNASLGSGLFPLRRHLDAGVRVALGSDVGGGTGFSLFKEGLQAYFTQQHLGPAGLPLTPTQLLHLVTAAGADVLGMSDTVGSFDIGKRFDAVWVRPAADSTLDVNLRHAKDDADALAKIFSLATPADVAQVWIDGDIVQTRPE